jgi:beta-lactamase class A
MAYFHQYERLKEIEHKSVIVEADQLDDEFGTLYQKGSGYTLNLREAVKLSITQSDNTAAQVLTRYIDSQDFEAVYNGLDVDLRQEGKSVIITVKEFSSLLKALYFSSVINKKHSQELLTYMTNTTFHDKLPAGVPSSIPVAHKIGVVQDQLYTDCGIVYVPRRHYILCMMSASDEDEARTRMKSVSSEIYSFVAR